MHNHRVFPLSNYYSRRLWSGFEFGDWVERNRNLINVNHQQCFIDDELQIDRFICFEDMYSYVFVL